MFLYFEYILNLSAALISTKKKEDVKKDLPECMGVG